MSEEIIDYVDVSGCRFLDEWYHCKICNELCDSKCLIVEDIECKTYDDCYYKQLKRLQAENEELKAQIEQLEDFIKSDGEIDHINHEYTYKLKKALEEIREIAKIAFIVCDDECGNANKFAEIQDKINEVLK